MWNISTNIEVYFSLGMVTYRSSSVITETVHLFSYFMYIVPAVANYHDLPTCHFSVYSDRLNRQSINSLLLLAKRRIAGTNYANDQAETFMPPR